MNVFQSFKGIVGPVGNPKDGSEVRGRFGRSGELVVAQLRGKYSELVQRGKVFSAHVPAVTIPVVTNNLVSVFGIYNPPGSDIDVELLDIEISQALVDTVVNAFGLYYSTAALSALATFTTLGSPQCNRLGDAVGNRARFYSAVTHSGTPVKVANIGQDGAVAQAGVAPRSKNFDGRIIIPPGILASVATSTAAGTASGLSINMNWAEIPIIG